MGWPDAGQVMDTSCPATALRSPIRLTNGLPRTSSRFRLKVIPSSLRASHAYWPPSSDLRSVMLRNEVTRVGCSRNDIMVTWPCSGPSTVKGSPSTDQITFGTGLPVAEHFKVIELPGSDSVSWKTCVKVGSDVENFDTFSSSRPPKSGLKFTGPVGWRAL